jgi:glycerophosphoryl diester phosphodiesterase
MLKVPSWLVDVPLAHRGLHGDGVPENSLPAFAATAAAGYGVELDVMLSNDGEVVVVHDPTLSRVVGRDLAVHKLRLAELQRLRLVGTDERIPTLTEALRTLGEAPTMVEVKQPRLRAGLLEATVAEIVAEHPGPLCVAGFNPATLRWFRRHQPDTPRVLTAGPLFDTKLPGPVRRRLASLRDLPVVAPQAVSYELVGLPNPAATRWREDGGVLLTWTVADEEDLARARREADNVIFEHVRP